MSPLQISVAVYQISVSFTVSHPLHQYAVYLSFTVSLPTYRSQYAVYLFCLSLCPLLYLSQCIHCVSVLSGGVSIFHCVPSSQYLRRCICCVFHCVPSSTDLSSGVSVLSFTVSPPLQISVAVYLLCLSLCPLLPYLSGGVSVLSFTVSPPPLSQWWCICSVFHCVPSSLISVAVYLFCLSLCPLLPYLSGGVSVVSFTVSPPPLSQWWCICCVFHCVPSSTDLSSGVSVLSFTVSPPLQISVAVYLFCLSLCPLLYRSQ